jgi:Cys-tRNA synthase (O-phospho-L-seryl-tRNA:Cys-tRNA synthase)
MKNAVDYHVNIICKHRRKKGYCVDELKKLIVTGTLQTFTKYVKYSKYSKI